MVLTASKLFRKAKKPPFRWLFLFKDLLENAFLFLTILASKPPNGSKISNNSDLDKISIIH